MPALHRLSLLAAACALSGAAQAMSLGEALRAARQFDGQFRVAGQELESTRQVVPMAKAALLPSLSLNASGANVTGSREFPNGLNQQVTVPLDYNAPQASLQLRTSLFNYEALSRFRQAEAQVESAEALYQARQLELVERTGSAYLQALLAHEAVVLAEAELSSTRAQLERAGQRFRRGEGTRTEVAQAQAAVDVGQVRLLETQDQLEVALRTLRRSTGVQTTHLNGLGPDNEPPPLQPQLLQDWIDLAERQSPLLKARRQNIEVADFNVDRNRAGHLPRLDLVASVSHARNDSVNNLNQVSTLKSIGVQLTVPIFSGGGVQASVRQAAADKARTEEELRIERETVQIEIQRQHSVVSNGPSKIAAYRRALVSSETALEGITKALAAGLSTTADVLEAQSRRYAALRDLAQARYEVLAARMRLLMQVGTPPDEVAADLDRQLTSDAALKVRTQP